MKMVEKVCKNARLSMEGTTEAKLECHSRSIESCPKAFEKGQFRSECFNVQPIPAAPKPIFSVTLEEHEHKFHNIGKRDC